MGGPSHSNHRDNGSACSIQKSLRPQMYVDELLAEARPGLPRWERLPGLGACDRIGSCFSERSRCEAIRGTAFAPGISRFPCRPAQEILCTGYGKLRTAPNPEYVRHSRDESHRLKSALCARALLQS